MLDSPKKFTFKFVKENYRYVLYVSSDSRVVHYNTWSLCEWDLDRKPTEDEVNRAVKLFYRTLDYYLSQLKVDKLPYSYTEGNVEFYEVLNLR